MDGRCVEDADCDGGTLYEPMASSYKNSRSLHKGFVSLYPLMLGQIKDLDLVSQSLNLIKTELLSDYGLRSLSNLDQFYHFESDYYRGNVFVWQNYLLLRGLSKYHSKNPAAQDVYDLVRDALLSTVRAEYDKTHRLYEYYDDRTGTGRGKVNFSWSALVVLIMDETYL